MGLNTRLTYIVIFIFVASLMVLNCDSGIFSSETEKSNSPGVFPLKVGNAWIYERDNFNNDETVYDTLYIPGKYQDQYKYTWEPASYFLTINNEGQYLIYYGNFYGDSLDPQEPPEIWSFYPEQKGWIEFENFSGSYNVIADSIYVDIVEDYPVLDHTETVYKETWYNYYGNSNKEVIYHSKTGFIKFITLDGLNTKDTIRTTTLVKQLTDFFPPDTTSGINSITGKLVKGQPHWINLRYKGKDNAFIEVLCY